MLDLRYGERTGPDGLPFLEVAGEAGATPDAGYTADHPESA
jgi:hypothetical protein